MNSIAPIEQLELSTALNVSPAVWGERGLERLIDTLMRMAAEQTGAERGVLMLTRGNNLTIESEATRGGNTISVRQREASLAATPLPQSIIDYVLRTREALLLEDASLEKPFLSDSYVRAQKARSILCVPLRDQARLVAVLFLENNLTPRVFTPAHIAALKALAPLAAIALEQALLDADRRQTEQALRESEEQWRAAFDSNPTMCFMVDRAGTILSVNPSGAGQLGYAVSELLGQPVLSVFLESERETVQKHVEECFAQLGQTLRWEARKMRKDGEVIWVRETASTVSLKNCPALLVVCEDITERKRAEDRLRQSEAYLSEAQRLSHTGSWAWSDDLAITYWSEECFRVLGFDPIEGLPKFDAFLQRIHPDDRRALTERIRTALDEKVQFEMECCIVRPCGEVCDIYLLGHPVLDASNQVVEVVGTVVDTTERKRAEEARLTHLWFLESMDRINRAMQGTGDLEKMMSDVLDATLEIFVCDRAWLIYPCDPWRRPGERSWSTRGPSFLARLPWEPTCPSMRKSPLCSSARARPAAPCYSARATSFRCRR